MAVKEVLAKEVLRDWLQHGERLELEDRAPRPVRLPPVRMFQLEMFHLVVPFMFHLDMFHLDTQMFHLDTHASLDRTGLIGWSHRTPMLL